MRSFIDALGGDTAVASALGIKRGRVAMWKERGIPLGWRARFVALARDKAVTLPDGFVDGLVIPTPPATEAAGPARAA